jgi:hypothetical protein
MAFDLFEHNAQNETKNELETFTACSEHALAYVVF